ncbi:hypothetical protein C484_01175 [Natrialba taiwanensis DSM 12281]|uniref:Uncharacterized protein n=1 Tax=Natrialba taiwanensis DSM 12281 TaxID=1230458 RepID=M0AG02_9EURY|nr:hypothetical protein C484_01175 [Natrialba taiwanensis DSM 12281]
MGWNIAPGSGVDSQTSREFVERTGVRAIMVVDSSSGDTRSNRSIREAGDRPTIGVIDAERRSPCLFSRTNSADRNDGIETTETT